MPTPAFTTPSPSTPVCSTVTQLPLDAIHPDPRNPRAHSKRQIRQIARSIEAFGFNVPILIDRNSQLIAGHGRLEACRLLGWTEVPTIQLDHLSPAQAQAYMIADNRLTETSTWDDKLLAQSLKELAVIDLDFTLDVIGFDMGQIDFRIESLDAEVDDDPGDILPMPSPVAVTAPGDLWLLGPHRLLCANSLEADSYVRLMAGHLAAVVFEDAPYNVKIDGHVGGNGAIKHREFAMASGEMSSAEFTEFLTTAFGHAARHSKKGSIHFQCMDWRHVAEITAAGQAVYSELKNIAVWVKNVGGMGSLYRSRHELVFVFKHGSAPHINNVELGRHGRYRTNVWEYPGISSSRAGEEGDLLKLHPTVKPIRLVADAILDCSNRGDIVLDAFLGSGTTLMAAQRVGRVCYGLEIDPLYVDTAIRRWQADTGLDAIHAESGMSFSARVALALVAPPSAVAQAMECELDREVRHGFA